MTATETAPADVPAPAAQGLRSAVPRLYLVCAVVAFALGSIAYGATAAKLVWPEFLSGEAILAYGRLLPAASNVLVLGWLTLGLAGAAIWLAPRLGGARPAGQLTLPGLLLIIGGLGGGVVAVLAGENAGGRYLELPWWADVAVAAGLAAVAVAVTRALRSAAGALPLSAWYLIAGLWVQLAGVATGVIPGLDGVSVALQGRFAASVITFAGPVLIGLGVAYFLVGALAQETEFHPRLGSIGFWSLLFSLLWMAPRDFQNGPTPDWLETVPVLLGAVLTVAAVTIAADFAHALRGKWPAVAESRSLRLSVLGVALVPVTAAVLFVSSLRGPSAVLHFTLWEGGIEVLVLFGAGTMFLLAAVHHAVPKGRPFPVLLGVFQVWAFPAGLAAVLVSRWIGGLQQGYTW
ncbi:MAG TPA: cbb3-type cytochrome c oxidase subunit I, partial [Gemmatimonadales bacterium]|nr:cbb3-type cytochrome c oxidase subunit I [Gemmatimonadales bacterium]